MEPTPGLEALPPDRFVIIEVIEPDPGKKKKDIKNLVQEHGLDFEAGRGFYEFTKKEKIQQNKKILLRHKTTGRLFTGPRVRELLELPVQGGQAWHTEGRQDVQADPVELSDCHFFVQSTSQNRGLIIGTILLYEVQGNS